MFCCAYKHKLAGRRIAILYCTLSVCDVGVVKMRHESSVLYMVHIKGEYVCMYVVVNVLELCKMRNEEDAVVCVYVYVYTYTPLCSRLYHQWWVEMETMHMC